VFSSSSSLSADGVVNQWSTIKKTEQNNKQYSPVEAILQISQEASEYGFDWENPSDILRKVEEEVKEVEEAIQKSNSRKIEQEIGDLLFAVINITRYLNIDPVKSLERGRRKFEQRFRYLQKLISKEGRDPKAMTAKELDDYWNRVKSTFSSKLDDDSV
jgi:tetrapyrrole methylase family protein/MazG family protein